MKKAIETFGLHLTVLLHKAGADDQAYEEIIESLSRAKERAQNAPQDSLEKEEDPKRTTGTEDMKSVVASASEPQTNTGAR